MSSYLSQEYKIQAPQTPGNIQVIDKTLKTLEGNYNANKAMVDQTLALYDNKIKGLREEDNEYIANKIKDARTKIEEFGKKNGNLAYATTRDSMLSAIYSVSKDPLVELAVQQKGKYDQYNLQVDEIKKKDPKKYSDLNYSFGLEQGGFSKYMKGETKELGSMKYTEYTNLPEEHSKRLQEYVDKYDDEQLLQSGKLDAYHTVDIYGKRVLKEDLKNFLTVSMDAKEQNQLMINAWGEYKDTPEEAIVSMVKPYYENNLKEIRNKKAEYDAEVSSGKIKPNKEFSNQLDKKITELSTKVNNNTFSKQDAYSLYGENYLNQMADAFDKNIITKKEVDDAILDTAKFENDKREFALNYDQKERELALKTQEVQLLEDQTLGTKTEIPAVAQDEEQTQFAKTLDASNVLYKEIEAELVNTNPKFAALDSDARARYINRLDFSNPANIKDAYSKNLVTKHNEYKQLFDVKSETYSEYIKSAQKVTYGAVNDMMDSVLKNNELNINSLSAYMPVTASVLKRVKDGKKKINLNDLSDDVRYAMQIEAINASSAENNSLSNDQRTITNTASLILKRKIKDKSLVAQVDKNTNTTNEGFFEEIGAAASELTDSVLGAFSDLKDPFVYGINVLKEGKGYADKQAELNKPRQTDYKKLSGFYNLTPGGLAERFFSPAFQEEENLSNIEARDLQGRKNIGDRYKELNTAFETRTQSKYSALAPNQNFNYAIGFSTENKAQKPIADLIKQTIIANNGAQPSSGENNFTIIQEGEGYKVSYLTGSGAKKETVTTVLPKLPTTLSNMVNKTKDNWANSIYNPALKFTPFSMSSPQDGLEAESVINNIYKYGNNVPLAPEIADKKTGVFKPAVEYIRQDVDENIYEKYQKKVDSFLSQEFSVKTGINQYGQIESTIQYLNLKDGRKETDFIPLNIKEKDDVIIQLAVAKKIDEIKKESLQNLK